MSCSEGKNRNCSCSFLFMQMIKNWLCFSDLCPSHHNNNHDHLPSAAGGSSAAGGGGVGSLAGSSAGSAAAAGAAFSSSAWNSKAQLGIFLFFGGSPWVERVPCLSCWSNRAYRPSSWRWRSTPWCPSLRSWDWNGSPAFLQPWHRPTSWICCRTSRPSSAMAWR